MRTRSCGLIAACLLIAACGAPDVGSLYKRQDRCAGLGDYCSVGINHCCSGMTCGHYSGDSGTGDSGALLCCVETGQPCAENGDCCSNSCVDWVCAGGGLYAPCTMSAQCGAGFECSEQNGLTGSCVKPAGGACTDDTVCEGGFCGANGSCACSLPADIMYETYGGGDGLCANDTDCCPGYRCVDLTPSGLSHGCCAAHGAPCSADSQSRDIHCCSGFCLYDSFTETETCQ
jgi:hypothetical protein